MKKDGIDHAAPSVERKQICILTEGNYETKKCSNYHTIRNQRQISNRWIVDICYLLV